MQLILHTTRHEALTASETRLTRWSLDTTPASMLAQYWTAPESVFHSCYTCLLYPHVYGGIISSPDGMLFAHQQLQHDRFTNQHPCVLEWRSWDDLSVARTCLIPSTLGEIASLACSPDGRWLVLEAAERLFLLDWQTGDVMSLHDISAGFASSLAFDPTSTYVAAALSGYDFGGSFPKLWRLDPAEQFIPRPELKDSPMGDGLPRDVVKGRMALTLLKTELDQEDIEEHVRILDRSDLDIDREEGLVAFSPQGRQILFSLNGSLSGGECVMIAYAVPSGKALWRTRPPVESSGQAIFSPDGRTILLPEQGGDLLVYRAEDGTFLQRLPTHLGEPVQALAFDHDGKLWLATEEQLVPYQPPG